MHWYQRLRDNGGGFEQQFLETASCCQNCGEISWQENPSWPDKHITRKNSPWYYCIHSVVIANRWWRHFSFRYAILLRIGTVVCIFPLAAFRSPILTRNFWKSPWKMWHHGNTWASPPKKRQITEVMLPCGSLKWAIFYQCQWIRNWSSVGRLRRTLATTRHSPFYKHAFLDEWFGSIVNYC